MTDLRSNKKSRKLMTLSVVLRMICKISRIGKTLTNILNILDNFNYLSLSEDNIHRCSKYLNDLYDQNFARSRFILCIMNIAFSNLHCIKAQNIVSKTL